MGATDSAMASSRRLKGRKQIRRLVAALLAYEPEEVYVFGSWARGEEDSLSDLDVVVIKETATPFLDRLRDIARILPGELGAVDVLVYTPEEFGRMLANGNALAETVMEEGCLIYGRKAAN